MYAAIRGGPRTRAAGGAVGLGTNEATAVGGALGGASAMELGGVTTASSAFVTVSDSAQHGGRCSVSRVGASFWALHGQQASFCA